MKIIKPGIPRSDPEYTAGCLACGCEFEFYLGEAKHNAFERVNYIVCPQEGCRTWVYEDKWMKKEMP